MKKKNTKKRTSYQIITQTIVDELKKGNIPWKKPWKIERPRNIRGSFYKGINLLLLSMKPYSCPVWATFLQIKQKGGKVKKGEKGSFVVFKKAYHVLKIPEEKIKQLGLTQERIMDLQREINKYGEIVSMEDEDLKKEIEQHVITVWTDRLYTVFNLEQTTLDIDKYWKPATSSKVNPVEKAENIINNMPQKPPIYHRGQRAYYDPQEDIVVIPHQKTFKSTRGYYETIFHELVHSTGHPKRLNRKSLTTATRRRNSKEYSLEELVAVIGSAFLCAEAGIKPDFKNVAAYCKGWIKVLQNDQKIIFKAASMAQKAVDFILNKTKN